MAPKKHKKKPSLAQIQKSLELQHELPHTEGEEVAVESKEEIGHDEKAETVQQPTETSVKAADADSIDKVMDSREPEASPAVPAMDEEPAQINGQENAEENKQETSELPAVSSTTASLPNESLEPVLESQENEAQESVIAQDDTKDIEPGETLPEVASSTEVEEEQIPVFSHEQPQVDTADSDATLLELSVSSDANIAQEGGEPLPDPNVAVQATKIEDDSQSTEPDLPLNKSSDLPEASVEVEEPAFEQSRTDQSAASTSDEQSSDPDLSLSSASQSLSRPSEPTAKSTEEQADPDLSLSNSSPLADPPAKEPESASPPFTTEHPVSNSTDPQQEDIDLILSAPEPLRESPAVTKKEEQAAADIEAESMDTQVDSDLRLAAPVSLSEPLAKEQETASSPIDTEDASPDNVQQEDADLRLSAGEPPKEYTAPRDEEQESENAQADEDLKLAAPTSLPEAPSRPEENGSALFTTGDEAHEVKEEQADEDLQLASGGELKGKADIQPVNEEQHADPDLSLSTASSLPDPPIKPKQDVSAPFTTEHSAQPQSDLEQADPDLSLSPGSALPEPQLETIPEGEQASFEEPSYSDLLASRRTSEGSIVSAEGSVMSTVTEDLAAMAGASVGTDDPAICVLTEPIAPVSSPDGPTALPEDDRDYSSAPTNIKVPVNFTSDRDQQAPASDFPDFGDLPQSEKKPAGPGPEPDAPSLTMSIFNNFGSPNVPWKRRVLTVLASLGINLFLPFVNGVMLGFGEIFAREWVSIYFGIGPHSEPGAPTRRRTANVSSVGLRGAGERGGGNVRPDHPAAKSAIEVAAETALNG